MLTSKLQAQCCKDTYDVIFVSLSGQGLTIIDNIVETTDLWNEKLTAKGRPNIQPPIIIGLGDGEDNQDIVLNQAVYASI